MTNLLDFMSSMYQHFIKRLQCKDYRSPQEQAFLKRKIREYKYMLQQSEVCPLMVELGFFQSGAHYELPVSRQPQALGIFMPGNLID